jgi:hypothetical protein
MKTLALLLACIIVPVFVFAKKEHPKSQIEFSATKSIPNENPAAAVQDADLLFQSDSLPETQMRPNQYVAEMASNPVLDKVGLGLGVGLNYGGIGANLTIFPTPRLGLFGGLGNAMAGTGYNVGIKYRVVSETATQRTNFFLLGMYGYNAVIAIDNLSRLDKFFYGPSFGLGIDFGRRQGRKSYWSMGVIIPIRSGEVKDYMEYLEDEHNVEFEGNLLPIAITVGYVFGVN